MKKLLFTIMIFSFAATLAMASNTRVLTMGDVNTVVIDEANIQELPHVIRDYPKLFTAEYSSGSEFSSVGVHMPLRDEDGSPVFGFYFYNDTPYTFGATNPPENPFGGTAQNQRLTVFYGTTLSDNPFGLSVNYIQASEKSDAAGDETKRSNFGLDFMASMMFNENLEIATGVSFWSFDDKNAAGTDVSETSGNFIYDLHGRYWMNKNGRFQKVFHAGFNILTQTLNSVDYSDFGFNLGLGCNYQSTENILAVTDFGVMFMSSKADPPDNTDTYFTLPYFKAGIDAGVFKWANLRGGVASYWNMDKYENDTKYNYVNTSTYFGAGVHWGSLEIDAQVSPAFLSAGPYFISGSSAGDLASRFSLNYWLK